LPVKIAYSDGKMVYQSSEGGLATGLSSVFTTYESLWIGWAGAEIKDAEKASVEDNLSSMNLHPVFLDKCEIANFYEGFSNEVLWPLFHYFPANCVYDHKYWETYRDVNRKFADKILKHATEDDIIWVHDYQLMLVPQMLRESLPNIRIGYFQHIPFPSLEVYRALPWRAEILAGLLGADTIGFQTEEDKQNFLHSANSILKVDRFGDELMPGDRTVKAEAFPISIDYAKFRELAVEDATKIQVQKLKKSIHTKLALSIDRLDYSKGIIQRLKAYARFLDQHPEWHEKVTLFHLVVPSRDNVRNYRELKEEMNKLISDINGKFSTVGWEPITHFYRAVNPNLLSALYKTADLALVTPLRDGMNLVSKEYVASKIDGNGVLLLSETAGAAKELTEALILNPNDIESYADKIFEGLTMADAEKKRRMLKMQQIIEKANIFHWAERFVDTLTDVTRDRAVNVCVPVNNVVKQQINMRYAYAQERLILLDYDGTMVPFFKNPQDAKPDKALLQLLATLASDARNNVVIVSGRDSETLSKWLGHLPVAIIAEHGAKFKESDSRKWHSHPGLQTEWKEAVTNTFASYSSAIPGAFIEEKAFSIAWHYRAAEKVGEETVKQVIYDLKTKMDTSSLDILDGDKVIEVKSRAVNKGKATLQLAEKKDYDFIMAIGDDTTDEDMFKALPSESITIKVGSNMSAATYCQASFIEVRSLLSDIQRNSRVLAPN
jgi:trehalose 6-phosphate synthase/phosphatase